MNSPKKIPLVELFGPTIQGEGIVIGQQTYFLRFGLCDYLCKMCDSMHAVDPKQVKDSAQWLTQEEIFSALFQYRLTQGPDSTKNVTFSGGNPCIHDLRYLTQVLKADGWTIIVETQGTKAPDWLVNADIITVSPKGPGMGENTDLDVLDQFLFRRVASNDMHKVNFKIVVFDQRDLEFAKMMYERYHFNGFLFFLSLGNTEPPGMERLNPAEHMFAQIGQYRMLFEEIKCDPILSTMKFLPQWHHFVWQNEKGK